MTHLSSDKGFSASIPFVCSTFDFGSAPSLPLPPSSSFPNPTHFGRTTTSSSFDLEASSLILSKSLRLLNGSEISIFNRRLAGKRCRCDVHCQSLRRTRVVRLFLNRAPETLSLNSPPSPHPSPGRLFKLESFNVWNSFNNCAASVGRLARLCVCVFLNGRSRKGMAFWAR